MTIKKLFKFVEQQYYEAENFMHNKFYSPQEVIQNAFKELMVQRCSFWNVICQRNRL